MIGIEDGAPRYCLDQAVSHEACSGTCRIVRAAVDGRVKHVIKRCMIKDDAPVALPELEC